MKGEPYRIFIQVGNSRKYPTQNLSGLSGEVPQL